MFGLQSWFSGHQELNEMHLGSSWNLCLLFSTSGTLLSIGIELHQSCDKFLTILDFKLSQVQCVFQPLSLVIVNVLRFFNSPIRVFLFVAS